MLSCRVLRGLGYCEATYNFYRSKPPRMLWRSAAGGGIFLCIFIYKWYKKPAYLDFRLLKKVENLKEHLFISRAILEFIY
jgi:hypothetical protein